MAKSQQTFNKLEREKNKAKKERKNEKRCKHVKKLVPEVN